MVIRVNHMHDENMELVSNNQYIYMYLVFSLCLLECQMPSILILWGTKLSQGNTQCTCSFSFFNCPIQGLITERGSHEEFGNGKRSQHSTRNQMSNEPSVCGISYPCYILWLHCSPGSGYVAHAGHCAWALHKQHWGAGPETPQHSIYQELCCFYYVYKLPEKQNCLIMKNNVPKMFNIISLPFLSVWTSNQYISDCFL